MQLAGQRGEECLGGGSRGGEVGGGHRVDAEAGGDPVGEHGAPAQAVSRAGLGGLDLGFEPLDGVAAGCAAAATLRRGRVRP